MVCWTRLILARLEATWGGRTKAQRSQAWIDRQMDKSMGAFRPWPRAWATSPTVRTAST
jgi:glutathione S-transferase